MADQLRLAIVDKERCKSKKCRLECKGVCPINRADQKCIVVPRDSTCRISEALCIGCGACVKKCPFKAIQIVNLPKALDSETIHRYDRNGFKLHRLPNPRPEQVLGLVGQNGIGKSTALAILSMKLRPNLGKFDPREQPEWSDIVRTFRGSELQNYFNNLLGGNFKVITKPQHVDALAKISRDEIGQIIRAKDTRNKFDFVIEELELGHLLTRTLQKLSGGERQRFAIAIVAVTDARAFFYDEPSSFLDIGQRMRSARVIRDCAKTGDVSNYVIVIEHDLAILDYMSDYISVLYGQPGAFGVISAPFSVHEGINNFLRGEIPTENMRFRDEQLVFRITDEEEPLVEGEHHHYKYPSMDLTMENFHLHIDSGSFRNGEIIVLLGRNGVGKTTFIRLLAKNQEPDSSSYELPPLSVSYKPQEIRAHYDGTVRQLLDLRIASSLAQPMFREMVVNPLNLEHLLERKIKKLSGGELQRVAIALALGKNADIYLIDEPSAYLDAEQRVIIAKIIKRYIMNAGKTAFIVEHDFIMATYLANRVLVFDGTPGVDTIARAPQPLVKGMNYFLKQMDVTLRADKVTKRPRINKSFSNLDKDQKKKGVYFVLE